MFHYTGWKLLNKDRLKIASFIPPIYNDTFPHDLVYKKRSDEIPTATSGEVVGWFDDKEGQQEIIFSIDGTTLRPDGRVLHLSWSRDYAKMGKKAKAFHSDHPLIVTEWTSLDQPIQVELIPKLF